MIHKSQQRALEQVALRSGWRQRELPEILEEDLMELARRHGIYHVFG